MRSEKAYGEGEAKGPTGTAPEPVTQAGVPAPAPAAPAGAGEEGGREFYELLKKIGYRKVIYWKERGEIKIYDEELYPIVSELLQFESPIVEFDVIKPPAGKWCYDIYQFNNVFVIQMSWVPFPPYSWTEEKIEVIVIKGENP